MKKKYSSANRITSDSKIDRMNEAPLSKINFTFMIISALIIILGFLLMLGSSSTPDEFNPDIFSTRRIVIGPTVAFIGFIVMGLSIIYRPKSVDIKESEEGGHA